MCLKNPLLGAFIIFGKYIFVLQLSVSHGSRLFISGEDGVDGVVLLVGEIWRRCCWGKRFGWVVTMDILQFMFRAYDKVVAS